MSQNAMDLHRAEMLALVVNNEGRFYPRLREAAGRALAGYPENAAFVVADVTASVARYQRRRFGERHTVREILAAAGMVAEYQIRRLQEDMSADAAEKAARERPAAAGTTSGRADAERS